MYTKQSLNNIDMNHMHYCDVGDGYGCGSASYLQSFLMFFNIFSKTVKYYKKNAPINIQKCTTTAF